MDRFKPEFILISAGFDGHRDDPLGGTCLTEAGYATLTRLVMEMADTHCSGRLVSFLEGGYNLAALAACVESHLQCLLHP
jgi:acetoin utilization deacetylase AcuC-like enzyme